MKVTTRRPAVVSKRARIIMPPERPRRNPLFPLEGEAPPFSMEFVPTRMRGACEETGDGAVIPHVSSETSFGGSGKRGASLGGQLFVSRGGEGVTNYYRSERRKTFRCMCGPGKGGSITPRH